MILITGANGFIGSNILRFGFAGCNKKGVDIIPNATLGVECVDLEDYSQVKTLLESANPEKIIHCAGIADVSFSEQHPVQDFRSNVVATNNILCAMKELQLVNCVLVFMSSAAVYGNPENFPITEDEGYSPLSIYALDKIQCEEMCSFFSKKYNLKIRVARIFSAYGPGLKKQLFWDAYQKYKSFGNLSMYGTGNESRDFIFIDDIVNAIEIISNTEEIFGIYNVANGIEITIKEAMKAFCKVFDIAESKLIFDGRYIRENPNNWKADITKLSSKGFNVNCSLEEGLKKFCEWVLAIEDI